MRFFPTVCSIYIFCICSYFYSSQLTINHSNQFICLINSPRKIYSFWVRNIFYFLIPNLTWRIYFCLDSLLTISYGNNLEVAMGNTLKVSETQKLPDFHIAFNAEGEAEPTILTAGADSSSASTASVDSATFTLAVTDPDAPSRTDKAYSEYLHYLVTGLKLKAPTKDDPTSYIASPLVVENGNTLVPYMGPGPPPKTGKHRYVFVLLRETKSTPSTFDGDRPRWGSDKPTKGLQEYAKKNGLVPVAVNFFFAQNEEQ